MERTIYDFVLPLHPVKFIKYMAMTKHEKHNALILLLPQAVLYGLGALANNYDTNPRVTHFYLFMVFLLLAASVVVLLIKTKR